MEYVGTQTAHLQRGIEDEDDDGYPNPRFKQPVSNPSWMANRTTGTGQLGATKRSVGFQDGGAAAKKPRTDLALPARLGEKTITIHHLRVL